MDFPDNPAETHRLMDKIAKTKAVKRMLVEKQIVERLEDILDRKSW